MNNRFKIYGIIFFFAINCIFLFNPIYPASNSFGKNLKDVNQFYNESSNDLSIASSEDWYRMWGNPNSNDIPRAMDVYNKTGDVYLIGVNYTLVEDFILLVKYNNSGDQEWNRSIKYDPGKGGQGMGKDVVVDQNNGDIYLTSDVYNSSYGNLVFVAKYSSDGQQQWNNTWGYYFAGDSGNGIALDNSNSLYVAANHRGNEEIVLIKFDRTTGLQLWNSTWNETLEDYAYSVACDKNRDLYVAGYTYKNIRDSDMVLIKFNETGHQKWNITWGASNYNETAYSVAVDSQCNVYVTGVARIGYSSEFMILRKYDNESNFLWEKTWAHYIMGGRGNDIYITSDDTVIVSIVCGSSYLRSVGYNSSGLKLFEIAWQNGDGLLTTRCISGYGSDNIYLAGSYKPSHPGPNDFILVKNPLKNFTINGNGGTGKTAGDNDDNDDDELEILVLILIIVAIISVIILLGVAIYLIRKRRLKLNQ